MLAGVNKIVCNLFA